MREKRSHDRLVIEGRLIVKTEAGEKKLVDLPLDNISFKGFSMYLPEQLETDQLIGFELMVEALGERLSGKGRIRHVQALVGSGSKKFKAGVEFIEMNQDEVRYFINRIQNFVISENMRQRKLKPLDFMPY